MFNRSTDTVKLLAEVGQRGGLIGGLVLGVDIVEAPSERVTGKQAMCRRAPVGVLAEQGHGMDREMGDGEDCDQDG